MREERSPEQQSAAPYGASFYYGYPYGAAPSALALLDPWRLMRKWRVLACVLLFAVVAAIGYLQVTEKVYRAASLIELRVRRPRILTQQAAVIDDPSSAQQSIEIFNTRIEKLKGRDVLGAALGRLDAALPGAFARPSPASSDRPELLHEKRLKRFEKALTITPIRRSRLIRVEFEHPDPKVAAAACNAFAEAAESSAYAENRITSDAAVVWLEEQAEVLRKQLLKAEDDLLAFRQEHHIDALESQRRTVEEALQQFNRALVEVESREAREESMRARLEQIDLDPERAGELPADIPRADEIRAALERWRIATMERNSLLATYTTKHPEVQAKEKMVALYRQDALKALERSKATTSANCGLLAEQAATLCRMKNEQVQRAAELEMQIVERRTRQATLERARDAADQSYRSILTRIQEARMAADENTATVSVVEAASVPRDPVHPRPLLTLTLALLLGVAGGLGLIVAVDFLEDRVAGPADLEGRGVPLLTVVPHVRNADREAIATATIRQQFSEVVEAFAGLGTMLDSPQHKERSQVILIASSIPNEGKTVASCNLAAILAKMGRRVLLVDVDVRRPRLASIFPIPPGHPDLIAFQTGRVSQFENLPYPAADCPNLHVIASRPLSQGNPAVTLGALAEKLVAWARTQYAHVVLDAPPLGLVSDVLALAPFADTVLVMVRPETSRKRLTWHTLRRLRESGIHNIALVVNDFDVLRTLYGTYSPYRHCGHLYEVHASDGEGETNSTAPRQHT